MTDSITKKCKKCGEVKNVSEFYYSNFWKSYSSPCKQCVSDRGEKYNQIHKAEHYERTKKWKEENPEKRNAQKRRNYSREPIKFLARLLLYRKAHPEVVKAQKQKRRATKMGNGGSFTAKEWIDLCDRYGNVCLCCKESKKLTADHVVPLISGGVNDISNIQPLCLSCNSKKGTKTIDYRKDTE